MEISTLKLCGVALVGAAAALILRETGKSAEVPVRVTALLLILSAAAVMAEPGVQFVSELLSGTEMPADVVSAVFRMLGVAFLARTGSELCREMGSASLGTALETAAKIEIIILTLPLVREAAEAVESLLSVAGL